jgi:glucans biosynthesis protein
VVHALLDSPSAAAAFRFTIRPGADVIFDTEMTLYPRVDVSEAGIATMTSMFLFDANSRNRIDDYRPAVHDSNGLLMRNGSGEQLWRPLANPNELQVSAFGDAGPRGFGLMQRKHDFADYDDLEAKYEKRPSLWAELEGDFGEGAVTLVEIPTRKEIHDNIVVFWRPKAPLKAKGEFPYKYRLHWCVTPPGLPALASVVDTRAGLSLTEKSRLFVLDIVGDGLKSLAADPSLRLEVSTDRGTIRNPVVQPNPHIGGLTASFELVPAGPAAELRAQLRNDKKLLSEVWVYRWTS